MFSSLGRGQYRNAVASGQSQTYDILRIIVVATADPTLSRCGTDLVQARLLTFRAEPVQALASYFDELQPKG